ncbi:MAG: NosD domain-containing protein [Haloplanus sp.]
MNVRPQPIAALLVVVLVLASVSFVVDPTAEQATPVPFEATNEGGLAFGAIYEARQTNAVVPRAEAFYAQYPYVVGYNGIPFLLNDLHDASRAREFGRLVTVYVSDFSDADVSLNAESTLVAPNEEAVGWVVAEEAYFVVDSRARTPGNTSAIVPFSERDAAREFTRQYGGSAVRWTTLRTRRFDGMDRTRREWRQAVSRRQRWANRTATRAASLRTRPVSVVVGEDAPTLAAAVAQAPANTTVRLPAGTYDASSLRISKPITVRGAGPNRTTVRGDGRGSVVNVSTDRVGITGLTITGVGDRQGVGETLLPQEHPYYRIRSTYGRGAAGITFSRSPDSLVANVTIHTPKHGIVLRESPDTVVTGTTIYGPPETKNNSLLLSVMASRVLVQNTTLYGGFDSAIVHNTRGVVVRGVHAEGAVTGFHAMYTREALVTESTFRDMFKPVMTATEGSGNAVVGNDVRNTVLGIDLAGSRSYVARNAVVHNRMGIAVEGRATLYTDNVIGYNHVGVDVGNPFPTNRITENDFVGNDRQVNAADENVLYVWTADSRGNYWSGFAGFDRDGDGVLDAPVYPTSTVGTLSYHASGGATVVRSPAVRLLRTLRTAVPGLRSGGVVDTAPLATPRSPRRVAGLRRRYAAAGPFRPNHDPDPYDYHASYDVPNSANDTFG